jgi:hypothetical protein
LTADELAHSCNVFASRIARLRAIVVSADQDAVGSTIGSLAELGLRAQTLGALLLLDDLHSVMSNRPSAYQDLFTTRLRTIDDVASFLFDGLSRVNRLWMCHRDRSLASNVGPPARVVEITRPLLYRSAIRQAQHAMVTLAADPDLVHFLEAGASRIEEPRISRSCRQFTELLTINLTREPDVALLLAAADLEPESWSTLRQMFAPEGRV